MLKIDDSRNTSPDNLFSIEEVACLGCCTLAPVVQIDGKTYGHVKPTQADEIVNDFLKFMELIRLIYRKVTDLQILMPKSGSDLAPVVLLEEARRSCQRSLDVKEKYNLNIRLKSVGCVGVCNQTPLMEIVNNDNASIRGIQMLKSTG